MGSAPKAPDPYATANAQGNLNYQTAQQNVGFSNADVYSPYGSSKYTQSGWQPVYDNKGQVSGYSPRYTQTITLSPEEEALRQQNTQLRSTMGSLALGQANQLQGLLSKPLSTAGMQNWQAAAAPGEVRQDQGPTDRVGVQDAMMRLYDVKANQQNAQQNAELAARGMAPGGQGYGNVMQGQQDARTRAIDQAYLQSGDEARAAQGAYNQAALQKYQMGADWAAQMNNLRQGQLNEAITLRDQPIKEMMTLMGAGAPNTPTFQSFQGQQMSAPNLEQGVWNKYQADMSNYQNNLSGLFDIAKAGIGILPFI